MPAALYGVESKSSMLRNAVANLLSEKPFVGLCSLTSLEAEIRQPIDRAVCLPVRNEEEQLRSTLTALWETIEIFRASTAVTFVLNDTMDGSRQIIFDWCRGHQLSYVIAEVAFDPLIGNAPHARRLAMDIGASIAPAGTLLTTDADTNVAADWIFHNEQSLSRGAGLVCGNVTIHPDEEAHLPAAVVNCGKYEHLYRSAVRRLWAMAAPPSAPPLFFNAMGASLSLRTWSYLAIGRLPVPHVAEDKALALSCALHDLSVVEDDSVNVVTSARFEARAKGGMGDALAERARDSDPHCDEALLTVEEIFDLVTWWRSNADRPGAKADFYAWRFRNDRVRMRLSQVKQQLLLAERAIDCAEFSYAPAA